MKLPVATRLHTLISKRVIVFAGAAMLLVSGRGQDINTFPSWNGTSLIGSWGVAGGTATFGQTFTATASQKDLLSMTFSIEAQLYSMPFNFRAYVFQWNAGNTTGGALFTSAVTAAPTAVNTFVPVTISTGGLSLTPGRQYVAFFSTSGLGQTSQSFALWAYLGNSAVEGANVYSGGNFVYCNSPSFAGDWQNPSSFSDTSPANDCAFDLAFAPIPEPSVISLACLGTLALAWRFRRSGGLYRM